MSVRRRAAHYLAATVVSAGVSLAALPLITTALGPRAFGAAALVAGVVGIGTALATLGSSFVVYRFLPASSPDDRGRVVAALCAVATVVVLVWAAFVGVSVGALERLIPAFADVPRAGVALGVVAMVLSPYWTIASDVLVLEERARLFSVVVVAQSVANAAGVLVALFVFELGTVSLFVGILAGAVISVVGAAFVLARYLRFPIGSGWRREVLSVALHTLPAQISESAVMLFERVLLSRFHGLRALGFYAHAQRYRDVAQLGLKAVARGAWATGLEEARAGDGDFAATGRVWRALHVVTVVGGVAMATVGEYGIALITNDRFTPAYPYAAAWFVYILVATSARPQVAMLFARGEGRVVARTNVAANLAALLALVALVPTWGPWGALAAGLVQVGVGRAGWVVASRRYGHTPWQDKWVLVGTVAIMGSLAVKRGFELGPIASTAVLLTVVGVLVWAGRNDLAPLVRMRPGVRSG